MEILHKLVAYGILNMISAHQSCIILHQDITQRRNLYGPQELLQPHQDVSQCGDYTPRRTSY